MEFALPPREYWSASKSIPSNVKAGPPALTATTKRLEIATPLEELDDDELLDDELLDEELLVDELLDEELEELELLDEEELDDEEGSPLELLPPQPVISNAVHASVDKQAGSDFIFIALRNIQHPIDRRMREILLKIYSLAYRKKKMWKSFSTSSHNGDIAKARRLRFWVVA